jgi:hypothetical protein
MSAKSIPTKTLPEIAPALRGLSHWRPPLRTCAATRSGSRSRSRARCGRSVRTCAAAVALRGWHRVSALPAAFGCVAKHG